VADASEIYEYVGADGLPRKGDPVELLRRLNSYCNGDVNELIDRGDDPLPEISIPAGERLAQAACQAFRLGKPWDDVKGEGVLESVWRDRMEGLFEYLAKKETPPVASPILSPPTESAFSPLATTTDSASTSTSAA
jgi:hypothetical protein